MRFACSVSRSLRPSVCPSFRLSLRPALALAAALATAGLAPHTAAQIGDRADKAGVVQKSLVPADQIPPAPVRSPAEALAAMTVAPGYKLELAAHEPLVQEPVAIAFTPDGRLWVVEMRGYMPDLDGNGEDLPTGRVSVLRDTDGDGRYDTSTIFVDNLVLPRAILPLADGVLIGAPPELALWRDTDGDGKADKKTVVATDYGVRVDPKRPMLANPERAPNSLLWAHDNWIYSAAYTKKFRLLPNGEFETGTTTFRGQWGLSHDDAGHFYHGSNSDHLRVDVVHADYLTRNPHFARLTGGNVNSAADQFVWPIRVTPGINRGYRPEMLRDGHLKEFTAAGGMWIYRGDLMPELTGNAFVAEPSAHFVRRSTLTYAGGTIRSANAYAEQKAEFIASPDERFRPVNFATGPDGALYVVDLYRGVLQHRISLTSYLRKQSEDRKLDQGLHLGRIYRVVPADRPAPRYAAASAPTTPAAWVEKLSHPNGWWRETAQRTLVQLRDRSVAPALRTFAASAGPASGRIHALWTLEGLGELARADVLAALGDQDPLVRAAAVRLSERFLGEGDRTALVAKLLGLAKDAAFPPVQLQAVLSLGGLANPAVDLAAANAARLNPRSPFLRDAFFSGLAGREAVVLERLAADAAWSDPEDAEANKIFTGLARALFTARDTAGVERALAYAAAQLPGGAKRALAVLDGFVAAAATTRRALALSAAPEAWTRLGKNATAKARLGKLDALVTWPGKPGGAAVAVTPLTAEQQLRFDQGKVLFGAICASCHQITGKGLDGLAPPLLDSEWVLGVPERTIRIVLHGVRGPITVLGRVHTGDMPPFGGLDDTQISSVLTYLRREWGHTASPVDPALVQSVRAATKSHTDAWSPEELMLIK